MYVVGCSVLILGKASAAIIQFGEDLVLIHGFADGKILWSDVVDLSRMFFPWIVGTLLVMLVFLVRGGLHLLEQKLQATLSRICFVA
jgi:hypothetical protein